MILAIAELAPGVDWVPFWTLAVGNVYRKRKQSAISEEQTPHAHRVVEGEYKSS